MIGTDGGGAMRAAMGLGLVTALAACGSGGGGYGGSDAPVPVEQSTAPWAQTICQQNFKCASKADIGDNNMAGCLQVDTMVWQSLATSVKADEAKGRVSYDPAAMGMCLSTLYHETCDQWTAGLTHDVWCREAFTPMVAVGGACQSDVECIGGSCKGADLSKMPPVEGVCAARVADGAACAIGDMCSISKYCDGTAMMCVAVKAGGTACDSDEQCASQHCNPDTSVCSGYQGCAVAPTRGGTILSLLAVGLLVSAAARRRRIAT
jgi:hypothetical protein